MIVHRQVGVDYVKSLDTNEHIKHTGLEKYNKPVYAFSQYKIDDKDCGAINKVILFPPFKILQIEQGVFDNELSYTDIQCHDIYLCSDCVRNNIYGVRLFPCGERSCSKFNK